MLQLHQAIQQRIVALLPEKEAVLEKRIGLRRADVAWEKEKIVFEIQCSPLSLEEAVARSHAYRDRGFALVWILHSKTFNERFVSPTEFFLRSLPCYYTQMNRSVVLGFYDQLEVMRGNKRIFRSPPLWINLAAPRRGKRLTFAGDRFTQDPALLEAFEDKKQYFLENSFLSRLQSVYKTKLLHWVKKFTLP